MAKAGMPLMAISLGIGLSAGEAAAQSYPDINAQSAASVSVLRGSTQLRGLSADTALDSPSSSSSLASGNGSVSNGGLGELAVTPPSYPVQPEQAVEPVQSNARTAAELGPYDPTGISVGSMTLYPSLTLWGSHDDNVDNASVGKTSKSGRIEGDLRLRSNWARHQLEVNANVAMTGYQSPDRKPDHRYGLDGELQFDLSDVTQLTLRSGLDIQREAANSVELRASGGTRSVQTQLSGDVQLDHRAGAFELQLRGGLVDDSFDEDKARDFKLFTVGGRVGYRYTDQVTPFVDLEMSRRRFDRGPNAQDGDRLRGAIGLAVNDREKWSGEVSIGQIRWKPDQAGQKSDRGIYTNASLIWSPDALWQVEAGLETSLSSTSTAASSVLGREFTLGIDYEMQRNLTLRADASFRRENYQGTNRKDWVSQGSLNAEYRLSRNAQLIGRYQHDRRSSTRAGEDYRSNLFEIGVRLQK